MVLSCLVPYKIEPSLLLEDVTGYVMCGERGRRLQQLRFSQLYISLLFVAFMAVGRYQGRWRVQWIFFFFSVAGAGAGAAVNVDMFDVDVVGLVRRRRQLYWGNEVG